MRDSIPLKGERLLQQGLLQRGILWLCPLVERYRLYERRLYERADGTFLLEDKATVSLVEVVLVAVVFLLSTRDTVLCLSCFRYGILAYVYVGYMSMYMWRKEHVYVGYIAWQGIHIYTIWNTYIHNCSAWLCICGVCEHVYVAYILLIWGMMFFYIVSQYPP